MWGGEVAWHRRPLLLAALRGWGMPPPLPLLTPPAMGGWARRAQSLLPDLGRNRTRWHTQCPPSTAIRARIATHTYHRCTQDWTHTHRHGNTCMDRPTTYVDSRVRNTCFLIHRGAEAVRPAHTFVHVHTGHAHTRHAYIHAHNTGTCTHTRHTYTHMCVPPQMHVCTWAHTPGTHTHNTHEHTRIQTHQAHMYMHACTPQTHTCTQSH